MNSIVSKARSVEEAIDIGLQMLNAKEKQVDIEILQNGSEGFAGMKKKKAVVKLSIRQPMKTEVVDPLVEMEAFFKQIQNERVITDEDSQSQQLNKEDTSAQLLTSKRSGPEVWVENGQFFVKGSIDCYASVSLSEEIILLKNGERMTEKKVFVSEHDVIDIQIVNEYEQVDTEWFFMVDEQKLSAKLIVHPGYKIHRYLKDAPPNKHIYLQINEKKEVTNTLTFEQIIRELETLKIVYGINYKEISKAIQSMVPCEYDVALGKESKDGQDGSFEIKVETETKKQLVEDDQGNIDYRQSMNIPTVKGGQVIGIVHPPTEGFDGRTIFNEVIQAKEGQSVNMKLGEGVECLATGSVIALREGRPQIDKHDLSVKVNVYPKLTYQEDVTIRTGNIAFDGDIEILGHVVEKMKVKAGGDIYIYKSVTEAQIISHKSITVRGNVIGSELSAGKNSKIAGELGLLLKVILEQVNRMIDLLKQLSVSPSFQTIDLRANGIQPIVIMLLEKKFTRLKTVIGTFMKKVYNDYQYIEDRKWGEISHELRRNFLTLTNKKVTIKDLQKLARRMEKVISNTIIAEKVQTITVSDAINSHLFSNGAIHVVGKGCVNTKIYANGKVDILGKFRGGSIYSEEGVKVKELGTYVGTRTVVTVPRDKQIKVGNAYEGTILKIGEQVFRVTDKQSDFIASFNGERIILDYE
ncbi:flagellar assembly protein A [Halalkalibacter sp. AB-rgal2]|uniref:flagellar assembly protein A n=1 Tax=Halalkalibacter sp. AB-rgal2 TaxID=3242695 RepID=UPI00359D4299